MAVVGDRFAERVLDADFADSAGTIYAAVLNQARENCFAEADDSFMGGTNPTVRRAFGIAGSVGAKGRTARVARSPRTGTWPSTRAASPPPPAR
ncbi:hypothetical protein Q5530_30365 [Saccharothrix sp. BKS2]|uniref:hypothetical protein n=1 Tax=Saccharothrix sp. BKS2 TaxID=3064400 RepID=UPI0039EBAFBF